MSAQIEWAEPPQDRRRSEDWPSVAAALREHPGKWAKVRSGISHPTTATYIKQGKPKAFEPAGSFEARSVSTDEGFDIYVRFVGEDGGQA